MDETENRNPVRAEITTRQELRRWLEKYAASAKCAWVLVGMKPSPGKLLYLDAVEECLCFGWIDGVKKTLPEGGVAQRISPRARGSSWTELNKQRALRLERMGLMREEGRRVYPPSGLDSFAIDEEIERRLREDPQVYANFSAFPELYRRIRLDTIQGCRRQPELFERRLNKLIAHTRENRMYGRWDDDGRLSDR
ncbi:YdeI/OmpD-associated family protein [Saccharibacillus alkalitolerans]|uniref:Thymidylate synthase n=1 Tax=Saccharibacillus alkalitolerans TaxID=2705290 RepID=A0ABX0FED2_9BACL|nr:YdeI/OmpD-associated family protein [Saccharibacillus alkalitolerans]NGZ77787.1 thymidylate synthase [Saccharibacillus alkalitolerans]